jgi:hypothetical protein
VSHNEGHHAKADRGRQSDRQYREPDLDIGPHFRIFLAGPSARSMGADVLPARGNARKIISIFKRKTENDFIFLELKRHDPD